MTSVVVDAKLGYGIHSVFNVPNSPGWVYVEATESERAYVLMRDCPYTYCIRQNIRKVEPKEYKPLLSPVRPDGIKENSWVMIRGGLYHGDVGQVRAIWKGIDLLDIAVVPRHAPPAIFKSAKRRRKMDGRPRQIRMCKDDAMAEYKHDNVKTKGTGFELFGKYHDDRGFRIITIGSSAVQPTKPSIHQITSFIDAALETLINQVGVNYESGSNSDKHHAFIDREIWRAGNIRIEDIHIDTNFKPGDAVELIGGTRRGMKGTVDEMSRDGEVTLRLVVGDSTNPTTIQYVEREEYVRLAFERGQTISVRMGVFAGRSGIIESIVDDGTLIIMESVTCKKVRK